MLDPIPGGAETYRDAVVSDRDKREKILKIIKSDLQGLNMCLYGVDALEYKKKYDEVINDFAKKMFEQRE